MSLTLTIAHNVFLTREQRYSLCEGNTLDVVGVSVPVWYYKRETSEPATEVFCKYKLIPSDDKIYVNYTKDGYELFLSKTTFQTEDDKGGISIKSLLDVKDGGVAWLAFRQFGKIKKNRKDINMIHFVEIKPMEDLEESL